MLIMKYCHKSSSCIWMTGDPHRVQELWSDLCWRRLRLKTKRTWCRFWFSGKIRGNTSASGNIQLWHWLLVCLYISFWLHLVFFFMFFSKLDLPWALKWPYSSLQLATLQRASLSTLHEMQLVRLSLEWWLVIAQWHSLRTQHSSTVSGC